MESEPQFHDTKWWPNLGSFIKPRSLLPRRLLPFWLLLGRSRSFPDIKGGMEAAVLYWRSISILTDYWVHTLQLKLPREMCEHHSGGHALLLSQMDVIQCRYPILTIVLSQTQIIHVIFEAVKAKIQKFGFYRCVWIHGWWFSCDKKGNSSLKEELWCPVLNVMKIINVIKFFYVTLTIFQKGNKTSCLASPCYYLQIPINRALFWMLLL